MIMDSDSSCSLLDKFEELNCLGVQIMSLRHLYNQRILSFNPDEVQHFNQAQLAEIAFLKPFIHANITDDSLRSILHTTGNAHQNATGSIFNWCQQQWVENPPPLEISSEEIIETVDSIDDIEILEDLLSLITDKLKEIK